MLLSPLDDFKKRTLTAIEGNFAKLRYIAGLRDPMTLRYRHWGLERSHGELAANEAIGNAHREVLLDVLRTPLRELAEQLNHQSRRSEKLDEAAGLERLMLPEGIPAAAERHFRSVLLALHGLRNAKGSPNHQSALPHQPPDQ